MLKTEAECSPATDSSPPTIDDLAMLVARLVQQVRNLNPATEENPVAAQAMDYLRRKDLAGSILREQGGK